MTKQLLLATLLTIAPLSAKADEYDNRLRLRDHSPATARYQACQARVADSRIRRHQNVQAFLQTQGGALSDPLCVYVQTDCTNPKQVSESSVFALSTVDPVSMTYELASCRIMLRNGLACSGAIIAATDAFRVHCLDAQGNSYRF